ncbi:ABC transporter ATP-binding protein [Alcaligenaceae bacterium]|nr:ABC transporter ATP-binding protein [Alcaligenaceae bacterium]
MYSRTNGVGLTIQDACKSYGAERVLNRVSLTVEGGSLLTLLGPSGCGKSTLLRIIAGFVEADHGDVLLDGQSIVRIPPNRRETAMVFQSYTLFPHMRVIDNVMFGLKMRQVGREDALRRAGQALEMVRLSHLSDRFPSQLSGGQMQRAALARALVTEPRVLLLDEPFGALDKNLREEMQVELRKLQQSLGVTTVCVTHDQQEAMAISDVIAVMNQGRIAQYGTPLDIYDVPRTEFVARFIGGSNVLRVNVIGKKAGRCAVRLADGPEFGVEAPAALQEGQAVALAVKPRALKLSRAQPPAGTDERCMMAVPGVVSHSILLGASIAYEVRLRDGDIVQVEEDRSSGVQAYAVGDAVWLQADGDACVVLEDGIDAGL